MQYIDVLLGTVTLTMPRGQAWHVVAQLELMQSESALHFAPAAHLVVQVPPQSTPLSVPFKILSLQLSIAQTGSVHVPLLQSLATAHPSPSPHFGHMVPPQSLAVSSPFCTPSVQLGAAHSLSAPQTLVTQSPKATHILPI